MEWFGEKFYGPIVVGVRDMEKALAWYEAFLDLVRQPTHENEAYVGLAFHSRDIPVIELYCVPPGQTFVGKRPILFTKNLDKRHAELEDKLVRLTPIQSDSGGNRYFQFFDLDGNAIEMCSEPRRLR